MLDKEILMLWLASKTVELGKYNSPDKAASAYMEGAILSLKETMLQVSLGTFDKKEEA